MRNSSKKFSKFQKKVYKAVLDIPLGETRSYEWVARKIGRPKAARAVGTALKNNPFTIIIPCHRVINSDGSLGGYSKGLKKKKYLLKLEKEIIEMLNSKPEILNPKQTINSNSPNPKLTFLDFEF